MKTIIPALTSLLLLAMTACQEGSYSTAELSAIELGSTRNVHRMGNIIFAGQPALEDWAEVSKMDVQTVVSLRHEYENTDFNEEKIVTEAGMEFVQIPFGSANELTDDVIEAVRKQLNTAPQPLLLHCASANRVGAVWIPFRVLDQGIGYEQALAEAQQIGLRSTAYRERIEAYLKTEQQESQ